ncbi:MAG: hypothetical protein RL685_4779 [Pseudomonadota bacterium]|jgi:hypothetical protein
MSDGGLGFPPDLRVQSALGPPSGPMTRALIFVERPPTRSRTEQIAPVHRRARSWRRVLEFARPELSAPGDALTSARSKRLSRWFREADGCLGSRRLEVIRVADESAAQMLCPENGTQITGSAKVPVAALASLQ